MGTRPSSNATPSIRSLDGLQSVQYRADHPTSAWHDPIPYPVVMADHGNNRRIETPDRGSIITHEEAKSAIPVVNSYTALQM